MRIWGFVLSRIEDSLRGMWIRMTSDDLCRITLAAVLKIDH